MLDIKEKKQCNGCRMCGDICSAGAIFFVNDELDGFAYPMIDASKCIHCGLCDKRCPQNQPVSMKSRYEPKVYAAWSIDEEKRLLCTSGGLFWELASYMIRIGGVVIACRYTEDFRGAFHTIAETEEELIPLCGSKHVQSNTEGIYKRVREYLTRGRQVFFVGSPCQVAALYSYLGEEPENLYTADFVCNSINSPKAQGKYIDYLEKKFGGTCIYARAKDKRYGWNRFGSSARFDNGREYYASKKRDLRVVGYHQGHLFVRESCYDCQYKQIPRNADITLGDFWGIEPDERNPNLEMGTSLVMINSDQGKELFNSLGSRIGFYKKDLQSAIKGNFAIYHSAVPSGRSAEAFAMLEKADFKAVVERYKVRPGLLSRVKGKVCRLLMK